MLQIYMDTVYIESLNHVIIITEEALLFVLVSRYSRKEFFGKDWIMEFSKFLLILISFFILILNHLYFILIRNNRHTKNLEFIRKFMFFESFKSYKTFGLYSRVTLSVKLCPCESCWIFYKSKFVIKWNKR